MGKLLVVIEKTETGYSAYVPDLPGCTSAGDTYEDIKKNIEEAVEFHLAGMREDNEAIPDYIGEGYELEYAISVEELFSNYQLKKEAIARLSGINPSLLRQYAVGIKHPSEKQAKRIEEAIHKLGEELLAVRL